MLEDEQRLRELLRVGCEFNEWPAICRAAGHEFSLYRQHSRVGAFDLILTCCRKDAEMSVEIGYSASMFRRKDIDRLSKQLSAVLHEVTAASVDTVSEIEVTTEEERHQTIVEWNDSERGIGESKVVQEWLREEVEKGGDRIAISSGGEWVSYGELERRSNQLGWYLREKGVGAEVRVGIWMKRGIGMVVGMLGVLKAGGAYVPMEGDEGEERIRYMVDNAGARVVIREGSGGGRVGGIDEVDLDGDWEEIEKRSERSVDEEVGGENLAYVIYTSGSTGRPKGVGIEHRQIWNYVRGISDRLRLERGWRYGLVSSMAADLGYTMMYASMYMGGSLHVVEKEIVTNAREWQEYCEREVLDCVKIVPMHMEAIEGKGERDCRRRG